MFEQIEKKKRLVSKRLYVRVVGTKLAAYSFAFLSVAVGLIILSATAIAFVAATQNIVLWFFIMFLIFPALFSLFLLRSGLRVFEGAKAIEPVQPITRHNTDHLPAEESLVRAASVPLQAQEAVLLRPTVAGDETPKEELLRAGIDR